MIRTTLVVASLFFGSLTLAQAATAGTACSEVPVYPDGTNGVIVGYCARDYQWRADAPPVGETDLPPVGMDETIIAPTLTVDTFLLYFPVPPFYYAGTCWVGTVLELAGDEVPALAGLGYCEWRDCESPGQFSCLESSGPRVGA